MIREHLQWDGICSKSVILPEDRICSHNWFSVIVFIQNTHPRPIRTSTQTTIFHFHVKRSWHRKFRTKHGTWGIETTNNDRTFQLILIKKIKATCNLRCMLIKQAVKNNNLTTLITDAYLYISIRLLSVLAFFFFFQHLRIYCNRRKMMITKPESSWKYDCSDCCLKISHLSHTVTFHSKPSQLEQGSIIVCSVAAQFPRAVSAHSLHTSEGWNSHKKSEI